MKIGVYISGLGQSAENDNLEKYAERIRNEFRFSTRGTSYHLKSEKVQYLSHQESTVVSLYQGDDFSTLVYRWYEFKYHDLLTENFRKKSVIAKSFWLFSLVLTNLPVIFGRIFRRKTYARPLQTLYLFSIFLLISTFLLLLLPTALDFLFLNTIHKSILLDFKNVFYHHDISWISVEGINKVSRRILASLAVLFLLVPQANTLISDLATEFVCANDYIRHGARRQIILGNLEHLIDYITEHEEEPEIHLHVYSFGSILGLDYLYPYRTVPSNNALSYCKALITIGCPYEFVYSYYTNFYDGRFCELGDRIKWLNVYSISDALSTNFRFDAQEGDAQFGVKGSEICPQNISYDMIAYHKEGFLSFLLLRSLQAHQHYWDADPSGSGCQSLIFSWMQTEDLFAVRTA